MADSQQPSTMRAATFFDVDGTLVQSTIAHYYAYFRRVRMSALWGRLWYAAFIAKCGYYLVLDRINRSTMNVVFYRSYRGLPVDEIKARSIDCHRDIIRPRKFQQVAECVEMHRQAGRAIVLVTGSIDFIVAPLAEELGADWVVAASLKESHGRFTGDLDGPPIGQQEKARRIRHFAQSHDIDLSQSYGYGDSIADLEMLETVGFPVAVNPDKALARAAKARGWPTHRWTLPPRGEGDGR
ncbi:MAG: HAD family hydrolase [Planctomycetes bacterium]|nr:HAD family hydrolase [Planctomycetota bacterium]